MSAALEKLTIVRWPDGTPVLRETITAQELDRLLIAAPVLDVQPVVHARWRHAGGDEWYCTACYEIITTEGSWEKPTKKYCHECGARMDTEEGA